MEKDQARKKTDRKLNEVDREMGRIYKEDSALLAVQKEYAKFMAEVKEKTQAEYDEWKSAPPEDAVRAKKAYEEAVKDLTLKNPKYKELLDKITYALAIANQKALDIANDARYEVYAVNYNQAAEELRKAGIKISG